MQNEGRAMVIQAAAAAAHLFERLPAAPPSEDGYAPGSLVDVLA